MKTKAVCPKCGSNITTWRGQIAVCTGTYRVLIGPEQACHWQGTYPKRVEVEELNEKEKV